MKKKVETRDLLTLLSVKYELCFVNEYHTYEFKS